MLKGSLVALVTPFNEDGSVNYDVLGELIEYHINNKTDGLVVLGTTGEASTMSFEEEVEVIKYSVKKVNKRLPLIIGAGSNDTLYAVKNAYEFSRLGADYLLVVTPYYNKTNEEGLVRHFEMIAEASSCPIILYNVPGRTGMNIPVSVVERLANNKNIIGIKEASGNISYAMLLSKYLNDDFVMFSGNDDVIVPYMSIGASGVISVLANIAPCQTHNICKHCLDGSFDKALKIAKDLLEVSNGLFIETNPIPVKTCLNHLGFNVGGYRMPLYQMNKTNEDKLIKLIDSKRCVIF